MRFVLDDAGEVCNIEYMNAPGRNKRPPKDVGDEKAKKKNKSDKVPSV